MAILSSAIRRSHVMRRLLLKSVRPVGLENPTARLAAEGVSRRGIHATSVVKGDALDMADTFSRRHGKKL
jgi:hypothetical protein